MNYRYAYEITMLKQDEMFKDQQLSEFKNDNEKLKATVEKLLDPKGKKKKK